MYDAEIMELTDSTLEELIAMSDADYARLDLIPDFDVEDIAYDK